MRDHMHGPVADETDHRDRLDNDGAYCERCQTYRLHVRCETCRVYVCGICKHKCEDKR